MLTKLTKFLLPPRRAVVLMFVATTLIFDTEVSEKARMRIAF